MKLLKNHSVNPPVFITDKPPLVNNKNVYNASSLLEHIKKQEEFNDLLLQFFNIQRPCSQDLLERESHQENMEKPIPQNPIKRDEQEAKLNNQQEEIEEPFISTLGHQEKDSRVLPEQLRNQEEKLPDGENSQKEEVEGPSTLTLEQLEHQEKPRRIMLEPIKKHKKKLPDMTKTEKEEIKDSSNLHLEHQEKPRRKFPESSNKRDEKVTDLINNEREEIEDFSISQPNHQQQDREDILELIKKLEDKVTDLINNQKEEIVDTLKQHIDKQEEVIQNFVNQENKFQYLSLGDPIEVIDGDSKIDGVYIEMSNEGLIWIDHSLSLCLTSMNGIVIRKKNKFET